MLIKKRYVVLFVVIGVVIGWVILGGSVVVMYYILSIEFCFFCYFMEIFFKEY